MRGQLSLLEQQRLSHPDASDAEHIIRWGADVIEALDLEPPIDPAMVASFLGVAEVQPEQLDFAGCLLCGRDRIVIKVRRGDPPGRRRFTICHECTHTFFPGYRRLPQYRCNPSRDGASDRGLERLCDVGAGELLLPRKYFVRDLSDVGFNLDGMEQLAGHYQASLEATAQRMVTLSRSPALLIVLEPRTKPRESGDPDAVAKLRVRASRSQGTWPYIPRHKSVEKGTLLHRAFEGEIIHEKTSIRGLTREPLVDVEVHARLFPYDHGRTRRVIALIEQSATSRSRTHR
jgi:hypothetical protein